MADFLQMLQGWLAWILFAGVSIAALALSCLSISGTWLVSLLAIWTVFWKSGAVGWWTVAVFLAVSALIEGAELLAGLWGVQKRGGSKQAGFAALAGGLGGLVLGSFIAPVIGPLIGMLAGSFALAYAVEKRRLQEHDRAAHIARGAVIARLLIILLKVAATLVMILYLTVRVAAA
ncbi:MAG: DUF456 domain-containing protein [Kiritimatiellia bacterium]